jgi:acyl-CoA thioesterase
MSEVKITEEHKAKARAVFATIPFVQLLGMKLEDIEYGTAVVSLEMADKLRQPRGLLHGGATASLIDTATAFAVVTYLGENEPAATVDLTVHYLRPVTEGKVTCLARVVRGGKRLLTVAAEAIDQNDKLIATALTTYSKV